MTENCSSGAYLLSRRVPFVMNLVATGLGIVLQQEDGILVLHRATNLGRSYVVFIVVLLFV